ncbi:Fc.00g020850.m01.CDS01 [Cosmosporella sp. VM-42]
MKEASSSEPPDIGRLPRPKTHGFLHRASNGSEGGNQLPLNETPSSLQYQQEIYLHGHVRDPATGHDALAEKSSGPNGASVNTKPGQLAFAPSSQDERSGTILEPKEGEEQNKKPKRTWIESVRRTSYMVITHSWLNVLLIFVPVGIAVAQIDGIHGGIVFAMNCIAIIPLAGLLAFATESVAHKLGDALGALLNVTFGNAVELIIFIALIKNEIRIVQASLLGSILANLLLILGMSFFLGGLRYREQIYNSTVTQMSACLLSLSVISLVLPTAFHASFSDTRLADKQSLKISRGTSVILLLVYVIYLLFQLKSHAYMYESTPQHIVDAESTPGPASAWLDSSSSESSSSSSSDSDDSDHSRDTMKKKMKKVLRSRRRRKSSIASVDTDVNVTRASSFTTVSPHEEAGSDPSTSRPQFPRVPSVEGSEEVVDEEKPHKHHKRHYRHSRRHKHKKSKKNDEEDVQPTIKEKPDTNLETRGDGEPRRVDFAVQDDLESGPGSGRRPFPALRGISVKNLAPTVFVQKPEPGVPPTTSSGPVPRVRYGIRRTNSLPDRLNNQYQFRPPGAMLPSQIPLMALNAGTDPANMNDEEDNEHLSQTSSVVLLLVSTALVAVCAEFLVGSIEEVVSTSSVGEIFIGLIILPIVGNAAEHVTAITVAMKNKMDLAIGVAVGSSIQIAIFITPLIVIIGWCMDRKMTLYFTLFETVCLFVSAFIVNFLVLDGRSNYLEGALLCAVYIIISVVAFFYPDGEDASSWGE